MSADPIAEALSLPNGARFYRCALQVNPHHYSATFRGAPQPGESNTYARELVEKAAEVGVSVLAVTDHNSVTDVPAFRAAAADYGISVFPGFELTSSEGVHILCIYPPETDQPHLDRFLGEFGIRDTGHSSSPAATGLIDTLHRVRQQGGLTIAAHSTGDHGFFKVLQGQPRVRAWRDENLLAIQIPGRVEDLPSDIRQIVENKNSDYRRPSTAEGGPAIAAVNAKDITKVSDLDDRSATCWIKMSEVSIEGLKQAFLDPGSRVRLNSKEGTAEAPEGHAELVALAWEGGFLDGAAIHLNPNLNVLVGGRGTGKSTIIESVRSALGIDPVGDEAKRTHEGIVRHVLKSGTKISLVVRTSRPSVREYRIERTIPNPPVVRDDQGAISSLSPQDILPRLEVYGQHEISELTKNREKLTRLLNRFVERDEALTRRKEDLARTLEKNRRNLIDARTELRQIEERLASLPGLEETLQRFRQAGLEERLREQSLLVREEQLLNSIPERVAPFRACVEHFERLLPLDRAFISPEGLEGLPGASILAGANPVFDALDRELTHVVTLLREALRKADDGFANVRSKWQERKQQVQRDYEKILRELQRSRVDGEEFIRLRRQVEQLRPLRERRAAAERLESEHAEQRRRLLAEWEDVKAEQFRQLDRAAKKVSNRLRERVQVEVTAAGDREPLFQILRTQIGGRLSEAIDSLRTLPELSLTKFVDACRAGEKAVVTAFRISPAQAERLAKAPAEVLMRIEELDLPPTTSIRLNTAPHGEPTNFQSLEELSTGQKATAVLLLLLLESEAPLIVDQPEDDLDNRFITDGIVPRMREEKQRRQFVFSTHNANIPVLGDAELIVGLTASGEAEFGRGKVLPKHMGAIDDAPVREMVEEILEGGKEAFERRRRKYGF